jgi:hypothetical protein
MGGLKEGPAKNGESTPCKASGRAKTILELGRGMGRKSDRGSACIISMHFRVLFWPPHLTGLDYFGLPDDGGGAIGTTSASTGFNSVARLQKSNAIRFLRLLISELMRPCLPQLARCLAHVKAIERALSAQKDSLEDHFAQLAAVDRLRRYLEMAQGRLPTPRPSPHIEKEPSGLARPGPTGIVR